MNIWKISTVALAMGMTLMMGRDAFNKADAATAGANKSVVGYDWTVEQPRMQKAIEDLRAARRSLELASEHRGGWRVQALQHTDNAITDAVNGMEYARRHPHDERDVPSQ